jgi:hypothetical protein
MVTAALVYVEPEQAYPVLYVKVINAGSTIVVLALVEQLLLSVIVTV